MKKILRYYFLISSTLIYSQNISIVNVAANDIVYSNFDNKLYISIPSSNGSNGNSIGRINPANATLERTTSIGSEPTVLAISSDGQSIYTGFASSSTVRKFNVNGNVASTQFPLGSDSFLGPYYAEDIEVMPNNPNTIAVSRRNNGFSPKHMGVGIYDNGVVRANASQGHTGSNQIEFVDQNTLVGFNNETTEFGFRKLAVTSAGVSETNVAGSLGGGFGSTFSVYNNKAYFTNGSVIDFSFSPFGPFVAGSFANVNGPVVYDPNTNLVCAVGFDNGNIAFKRFNPDTFLLVDQIIITQSSGLLKNIAVCGNGSYAINTSDNKVLIINNFLSVNNFDLDNRITIYPNPASDFINIQNDDLDIQNVKIYNGIGQLINERNSNLSGIISVDVSLLNKGYYFLEIDSDLGTIKRKFIKK